jgi:hypothetical protein
MRFVIDCNARSLVESAPPGTRRQSCERVHGEETLMGASILGRAIEARIDWRFVDANPRVDDEHRYATTPDLNF